MDADVERARRGEPSWDELRERRVLARVLAARGAQRGVGGRGRVAIAGGAAVALAAAASIAWMARGPDEATHAVATVAVEGEAGASRPARLALRDGSQVFLAADAQVEIEVDDRSRVRIVQRAGEARYVVSHRPERAFVVVVEDVEVRVRGTRFVVRRGDVEVEVEVEQGRVEVARGAEASLLGAGEALRVPMREALRVPIREAPAVEPEPEREHAAPSDDERPPAVREEPSAPPSRPRAVTRTDVGAGAPLGIEALLAEADAARRGGRLEDASRALRAAVDGHAGDPRVATALFTLGRVERARGRDAAAADAFERSYAQAPHGALAEDALAEAAVSWAASGRGARARETAERYLSLHPTGLYVDRVRHLAE